MRSIFDNRDNPTAPGAVMLLSWLFVILGMLMLVYALLLATSRIAFTQASWLIGIDAARMGPAVFVVASFLYAGCAVALRRTWRFGRWLAIILMIAALAQQVPAVSAAVAEFHWGALVREGFFFLLRIVCVHFLFREDVRDAFEGR